jgi:hypothetical protein
MKKYIPLVTRKYIIDKVVAACIDDKDGILIPDMLLKQYFLQLFIAQYYGDVTIPDGISEMEFYDKYCESGEMDRLLDQYTTDYCILLEAIDAQIEANLKIQNSIEGILTRTGLGLELFKNIDSSITKTMQGK